MAVNEYPLLDDFNRADGAPGANWTTGFGGSATTIVSNALKSSVADGSWSGGFWNPLAMTKDIEAWITLGAAVSGAQFAGLRWRARDSATNLVDPTGSWSGYQLNFWDPTAATKIDIRTWDGASSPVIWSDTVNTAAAGDTFVVKHVGSLIELWRTRSGTDLLLTRFNDPKYERSGRIGIEISDSAFSVDEFGGGEIKRYFQSFTPVTDQHSLTEF